MFGRPTWWFKRWVIDAWYWSMLASEAGCFRRIWVVSSPTFRADAIPPPATKQRPPIANTDARTQRVRKQTLGQTLGQTLV